MSESSENIKQPIDAIPVEPAFKDASPEDAALLKESIGDGLIEEERPAFISIPPESMLDGRSAPFDLFVLGTTKQFKVFRKGDPLDRERFDRYNKSADGPLCARVETIEDFLNGALFPFLERAIDASQSDVSRARAVVRSIEFMALDLFLFGYSKDNLEMKITRIAHMFKTIAPLFLDSKIRPLFFASRQGKRVPAMVQQSVGSTLLSGSLLVHLQQVPLLTLESFLVGTFLRDLSLYRNAIAERPRFDVHPEATLSLIEKSTAATETCRMVILQHHESPFGTGFPKGLKATEIFRLARIPLAAEKLMLILTQSPIDIESVLEDIMIERFSRDTGTTALEALKATIRESSAQLNELPSKPAA